MHEHDAPLTADQLAARRKGVRRTVWAFVVIALAIYLAFLLSGILGQ
jgi:hypothetical protein